MPRSAATACALSTFAAKPASSRRIALPRRARGRALFFSAGPPNCLDPFQRGIDSNKRQKLSLNVAFKPCPLPLRARQVLPARAAAHSSRPFPPPIGCAYKRAPSLVHFVRPAALFSPPVSSRRLPCSTSTAATMDNPPHCLPSPPCRSRNITVPQIFFPSRQNSTFLTRAPPCFFCAGELPS
jgi:hypothetical protein